jgi:hypothetical protein
MGARVNCFLTGRSCLKYFDRKHSWNFRWVVLNKMHMSVDQKSTMTAAIGQSDKIETYMGKWKNNFSQKIV